MQELKSVMPLQVSGRALHQNHAGKTIKNEVDNILRDHLAGFRQDRGCKDQTATLQITLELTIKWQSSTHMTFVDGEKAYDAVA